MKSLSELVDDLRVRVENQEITEENAAHQLAAGPHGITVAGARVLMKPGYFSEPRL